MHREGNLAGCLGGPQVVKEEMGIQVEGIGGARAKKGEHKGRGCGKETCLVGLEQRALGGKWQKTRPVCPAKEFRRRHRATKDL